jgi:hypothetical protein
MPNEHEIKSEKILVKTIFSTTGMPERHLITDKSLEALEVLRRSSVGTEQVTHLLNWPAQNGSGILKESNQKRTTP